MRLVVINDVSVARGGATAQALLEVDVLRRRGVKVTYVTGDAGDNPMFDALDVPVVALGEHRLLEAGLLAGGLRGLRNPRTEAVFGDWVRRNDTPDTIYHLHGWSQILSPSVFAALAPVRPRTVVTAHDFFLVCPNGAYTNYASGNTCLLRPLGARCLASACDKRNHAHKLWRVTRQSLQWHWLSFAGSRPVVLMIHEAMREPLRRGRVPGECLRALPNAVTPWSNDRIEAESNAAFVFVGRLAEEKGADLAAMAARRAGVPLTVIGDGPMLPALRANFPDVTFAGRLAPEQVAMRVRGARALVMPSRYPEPYGLVAVEALWSGIPVIISESALLAPDVVGRGAGLACDPRNETALAGAMSRIAANQDLARRMSFNAFERTRDLGLSPSAWADELMHVFEQLNAPEPSVAAAA
jgi:glycosyltransferase involved in cell wall biosynthesis